jgi:hypothetical protein
MQLGVYDLVFIISKNRKAVDGGNTFAYCGANAFD